MIPYKFLVQYTISKIKKYINKFIDLFDSLKKLYLLLYFIYKL